MLKAIFSLCAVLFSFNIYAYQLPELQSLEIMKISPSIDNIIFTFNRIKQYKYIRLSNNYFYIAIPNTKFTVKCRLKQRLDVEKIANKTIRKETRIYIRLSNRFNYKYNVILSHKKYLIVRITKKQQAVISKRRTPIVVIDPGHGGKDPGAIGIYDKEKNIVLSIALKVAHYLKEDGVKVILTRRNDTYPTLADRVAVANKDKADVFVSIHANYAAHNRRKAKGLGVYFLNTSSDKRTISLAARENGMSIAQIKDINRIILSMVQTTKIKSSKQLAEDVYKDTLKSGKKTYRYYSGRGVKQAPFYVLIGTMCPSILIETAFLNNPQDALYLHKNRFRTMLAKGIAHGILNFLQNQRISKGKYAYSKFSILK